MTALDLQRLPVRPPCCTAYNTCRKVSMPTISPRENTTKRADVLLVHDLDRPAMGRFSADGE